MGLESRVPVQALYIHHIKLSINRVPDGIMKMATSVFLLIKLSPFCFLLHSLG